jgi:hypothetical protein
MPQAALNIFHEVKTGEAWKCTSKLLQNYRREERQIKNADSQVEFR